jgi:hypothetical protein
VPTKDTTATSRVQGSVDKVSKPRARKGSLGPPLRDIYDAILTRRRREIHELTAALEAARFELGEAYSRGARTGNHDIGVVTRRIDELLRRNRGVGA